MVQDIHETSKPVGLNMHLGKTKAMCNPVVNKTDININGRKIEEVNSYIYLSQMVTKDNNNFYIMSYTGDTISKMLYTSIKAVKEIEII